MPFGQLPVLEVDGGVIAQSNAICRFIAKKAGLYGKDDLEQASIDMIIDFIGDLLARERIFFFCVCVCDEDVVVASHFLQQ